MTILILFFGFYTDSLHPIVDTIAGHFGYSEKQYAVIIDGTPIPFLSAQLTITNT